MKRPVRGGLKGGRRSVKRGQSVEFADFRDYSLGDDLRQLDWNVLARLEKLFIKLYVEEEDVTIHFLLDARRRWPPGDPPKLLFAKRAAAALGYIGLASEDRVAVTALAARAGTTAGRAARLRARLPAARGALRDRRRGRPDRPPRRRRGTPGRSSRGRGVIVLLSDLLDPGGRQGHPRARRDRLGADRPPRPLAGGARPGRWRATSGWSTSRRATAST